ncbi:TetR/AcrR family transcriptional regulator [Nocardia camponoti]|uniref:TetR family transcriptional regulator n=1 Tax=Nocardia camponoti TaxID=1616106 RepID=A0A917V5W5_9NOCA|nr:TetR/AcrR family transcriptional regulator [Nocardia camponoti]GGK44390.1 TetR family transcriptional regulator [Nocardia camponoti]
MSSVSYPTPDGASRGRLLPVGQPASTPRADAARNRALLLDAAQELVRESGVDALTMDALAKRAGVGKGTVFRRFGNRTGLMFALLDHSEQQFQSGFLFGPPPLGPGASPLDRLIAFGRARLRDIAVEGTLHRAAESNGGWLGSRPYEFHKAHVVHLLRSAGVRTQLAPLADVLLGALSAELVMHQTDAQGFTLDQVGDNFEWLVRRVVAPVAAVE